MFKSRRRIVITDLIDGKRLVSRFALESSYLCLDKKWYFSVSPLFLFKNKKHWSIQYYGRVSSNESELIHVIICSGYVALDLLNRFDIR